MPGEIFARIVPDEFLARHAAGLVRVVGNLILPTSGPNRILGQLQPTSLAEAATGVVLSGNPLVGAAQVVATAAGAWETHKLRAAVELMQAMQVATLATGVAGIGVSLAGFALLDRKLSRIERSLEDVAGAIDEIVRRLDRRDRLEITDALEQLRCSAQRVDDAWERRDPDAVWHDEERELQRWQRRFLLVARTVVEHDPLDASADALVEAAVLAGTTRTTALLACDELAEARRHAAELARAVLELTGPIGAPELLRRRSAVAPGRPGFAAELLRGRAAAVAEAAARRALEQQLQSAPLTVARLQERGISGRAFLEAARAERDSPFLLLPGDTALAT